MKTFAMVAAGLVAVSFSVVGQPVKSEEKSGTRMDGTVYSLDPSSLHRAAVNYAATLRSDCDGVVESSIEYSTLLRLVDQNLDMGEIQTTLAKLSEDGRTPAIRYKAYLALAVFENPAKFQNTAKRMYENGDEFFGEVAAQVHKTLLGHNIK